jgi:hypothetical protein
VDEAFESLRLDLHHLQCEVFAERGECPHADEVFIFPGEFLRMRDALRFFLARLFKETAYRESFYFRGLYFCGDSGQVEPELLPFEHESSAPPQPSGPQELEPTSAPPTEAPATVHRMVYFLTRLFEEKIFPEAVLARPVTQIFRRQSRVVWVAQSVALVLAIILAWGTIARYRRMIQVERTALLPTLKSVAGEMGGPPELREGAPAGMGQTACDLTQNMLQLNMNVFSSIFIPLSRLSYLDERVKQSMVPAFQKEVLSAVKNQLDARTAALLTPVPPTSSATEFPTGGALAGGDHSSYSVQNTPEYQALLSFTANLSTLQQNIDRYEDLRRPGQGSSEDLRGLADYLGCPFPPGTDITHNPGTPAARAPRARTCPARRCFFPSWT